FHNMSQEEMEGVPLITQVDAEFLSDLVTGVSKSESAIKEALEGVLTGSWSFGRLEVILRAILQAGVYELMFRPDIPRPVIINEYIDITHSYYEGKEPGFVNGILDELAKTLRA
ncbi:MAG: transcription antitermination factor NusB, partial [Sphingomonadales bacterium]